MIEEIGNHIKGILEGLSFADKVGGVVKTATIQESNDGSPASIFLKRFPVECEVTINDCQTGRYTDLVPNSEYMSIMYLEDNGTDITGKHGNYFEFRARLKLVGWLNLPKLGVNDCSISAAIIANIMDELPSANFNLPPQYQNIRINAVSIEPKNPNIFRNYSYQEEVNQYLLYPYDYFAVNLEVDFWVNRNCINEFVTGTVNQCLTK